MTTGVFPQSQYYVPRATAQDRAVAVGLWLIFASMIFLQRFGIGGVPLSFAISYVVIISLVLARAIVFDRTFLGFFLIATLLATAPFFLWAPETSYSSYLYLLSIYALYTLRFRDPLASFAIARRYYINFMFIAGLAGMAQFGGQFILGYERMFPLELLPETILLSGYNTIIPLEYGADIIKSTGVFFLEPSFFAQFLAIAVLLELLGRQRVVYCGVFFLALLTSYSGTGMFTLALFLPIVVAKRVNLSLVIGGILLVLVVVLTMGVLELGTVVSRLGEFNAPESSGFARFISPFFLIRDFLIPSPIHFLFGMGPGTIDAAVEKATFHAYLAHDPTWIKLVFEYGLVGGVAFLVYVISAMYSGTGSKLFATALLFTWLFLGGYLLSGMMNILMLSLGRLHAKPKPPRDLALALMPPRGQFR